MVARTAVKNKNTQQTSKLVNNLLKSNSLLSWGQMLKSYFHLVDNILPIGTEMKTSRRLYSLSSLPSLIWLG